MAREHSLRKVALQGGEAELSFGIARQDDADEAIAESAEAVIKDDGLFTRAARSGHAHTLNRRIKSVTMQPTPNHRRLVPSSEIHRKLVIQSAFSLWIQQL